ncbi:YdcF family protein [Bacillus paranthracis]|uniref:YdcF family protein n=1 Tax=Bacillus paranthracis TaxID=2026186 RepID=UPI002814264F|nr:YdcF family protein [Bacillus paranthracis]MDR0167924.1 YdcF family protein [Bacillus paranthracis]
MFYAFIPIMLLVLFLGFYLTDPRRIINGFLFNLFIISIIIASAYFSMITGNQYLLFIALIPAVIVFFMLNFGVVALIVGLFLNAKILMSKESRRFANSLTFVLGIFLSFFLVISLVEPINFFPEAIRTLYWGAVLISLYLFMDLSNFLTAYFLYQFNRPKYNQDFIIVLGSGLINDKVPPLLASRINRAIEFYKKQEAVSSPPKIIFSGGQGSDENISEAEAMQEYAVNNGIPLENTIKEDRSTTTYQNMLFSKEIIESLKGTQYNCIFSTNNFHVFRAGLYAKIVGLNSQGIGSKTAFYYWPNAMIREYIAIFVMNRVRHSIVIAIIMGFSILATVVNYLFF